MTADIQFTQYRLIMLATKKQISYLQHLTDRAEFIKQKHPSLIPMGLYHKRWDINLTSERASLVIRFYQEILDKANAILYPSKKVSKTEDLPA